MLVLPSTDKREREGVDLNAAVAAAASLPAAEEAAGVSPPAVTSPGGSAAVAQRGVAPLPPAPPAGASPPTGAMGQAVLAAPTEAPTSTVPSVDVGQGAPHNRASGNITSDHNRPWSCAPWAFLHNLASGNITSDRNDMWIWALGAFLLVFLLLGTVYLLMPHKFR